MGWFKNLCTKWKDLIGGREKERNNVIRLVFFVLISFGIIGVYAWIPHIFSGQELLFQILAAVLSVVFTVLATSALLSGQTEQEESREKNIKVHENKMKAFSQFVSTMWTIVDKGKIESEEIRKLRSEVFGTIIFYLDKGQIDTVTKIFNSEELTADADTTAFIKAFSKITDILRSNLINSDNGENTKNTELWNSFNKFLPDVSGGDDVVEKLECGKIQQESVRQADGNGSASAFLCEEDAKRRIDGCLHFNILDKGWQYEIFSGGSSALGLCEYGETWRTDRIKNVRNNQLVFLYQSGGPGYVGAFLVKGWVVFESMGDGKISTALKMEFGEGNEPVAIPEDQVKSCADKLRARKWLDDGCTRVSYLLVEPLFFSEKGVGRISVYRPTISSYDPSYAWRTFARMASVVDSGAVTGTYMFNGERMHLSVNDDDFKKVRDENKIRPSEWDAVSNSWIDR